MPSVGQEELLISSSVSHQPANQKASDGIYLAFMRVVETETELDGNSISPIIILYDST